MTLSPLISYYIGKILQDQSIWYKRKFSALPGHLNFFVTVIESFVYAIQTTELASKFNYWLWQWSSVLKFVIQCCFCFREICVYVYQKRLMKLSLGWQKGANSFAFVTFTTLKQKLQKTNWVSPTEVDTNRKQR